MAESNLKKRVRLRDVIIADDDAAIDGLKSITHYAPHNPDVSKVKIVSKQAERNAAHAEELDLEWQLAAARDKTAALEHDVHDGVVVMREQVIAQYGKSSDEAAAVGLKKKSEYR